MRLVGYYDETLSRDELAAYNLFCSIISSRNNLSDVVRRYNDLKRRSDALLSELALVSSRYATLKRLTGANLIRRIVPSAILQRLS